MIKVFHDRYIDIERTPDGRFAATDDATYDGPGSPVGIGATEDDAVAELVERLHEVGILPDPFAWKEAP